MATYIPSSGGFKLKSYPDYSQLSEAAARFIIQEVSEKPNLLLCLATGSTPIKTYDLFVKFAIESSITTNGMKVIKLDEWVDIPPDNPATCEYQLQNQLIQPLGIKNYIGFDSEKPDNEKELAKIHQYLSEYGPIDICILSIGLNGHLGFNEPGDMLRPFAHKILLSETSLAHKMLAGLKTSPEYGLTLGMADILHSRKIVLLVSGAKKKEVMQRFMQNQIDTRFPASFLWLHPDVTCFCDSDAWE